MFKMLNIETFLKNINILKISQVYGCPFPYSFKSEIKETSFPIQSYLLYHKRKYFIL